MGLKEDCYDDAAINDFIEDIQVDTYALDNKIDFSLYHEAPT